MIHTTIQLETIDVLSRSALTSVRLNYVLEAIKNTESSFEIIRILTSALIAADQEAEIYKKQCVNLSQKNPVIPPILLDKNQIFMGVDVAEAGKDVGVYPIPYTKIYNLPPYQLEIQNKILDAIGNYRQSHHGEVPHEIKVSGDIYTVIRNNQHYYAHEENQFYGIPVLLCSNAPRDSIEVS